MYYAFFGLANAPFKITPDTDVFFEGGNRGAILEALIYAISNGEGIIKVTGEVGSGKTMLCRVLQTRLPKNVETVYLADPSVSPEEILHAIAFELQLPIARDAGRLQVMHALNTYLLERHTHSFTLLPLDKDDVKAYLTFRLQAAGYHGPDLFTQRVIAYLTRASGGLTRRINLVADKALLAAFAEGTHNVILRHVRAAVRDSEFSDLPRSRSPAPFAYALGGLAIGGVIGVAVFAAYQTLLAPPGPASAPTATTPADAALPARQAPIQALTAATPGRERSATNGPASEPRSMPARVPDGIAAAAPVFAQGSPAATGAQSGATSQPVSQPGFSEANLAAGDRELTASDVLEQRLRATDQWLAEQNGTVYSIQLLGTNNPELLRDYFKTIAKHLEIEKVYVYRTMANQRPSLTLLYGNFADRAEVNRVLQRLPEELKTNRPYYRTIQGVRSEIARHRS